MFMVLMLMVVFLFFAMSLDAGAWYFDHRRAQNQADAAAHAAVLELPDSSTSTAAQEALEWLGRNGAASSSSCGAPPDGVTDSGVAFRDRDGDGEYDWVRVCVARTSPAFFAKLADVVSVSVSAYAIAEVERIPSPYSLMALDQHACPAFRVTGQGSIVVDGGSSYTASDCDVALQVDGQGELIAEYHDVVGGYDETNNANLDPDANTGAGVITDPFAFLAQPSASGLPCKPETNFNGNATFNLTAGRYCAPVTVSGPAKVNLGPGIYIFEGGAEITPNSSGWFRSNGNEVLLYGTCSPSPCGGVRTPNRIRIAAQADVSLTGHSGYENIVLWLDRTSATAQTTTGSCPAVNAICLEGGSFGDIDGVIYAARGAVDMAGNSGAVLTLNMAVVANVISFRGQGDLTFPYDPDLAPPEYVAYIAE